MNRQSIQVPKFGYNHESTDHAGARFSTHCKEDINFCEDGETTIAREGAIPTRGFSTVPTMVRRRPWKKNEVPQKILQARPTFRGTQRSADIPRFLRHQTWCRWQRAETAHEALEYSHQLKLRTRCARCRKLGHWTRECLGGNRGQRNDERYDRRAWRPEENPKGFVTVAGHTERRPYFLGASWTFVALDPGEVLWDTSAPKGLVGSSN